MLTYSPNERIRSFAVDPGTSTLGLSIVDVLPNSTLELVHADTINIEKEIRRSDEYRSIAEDYGMMDARLSAVRDNLLELLLQYKPHVLSLETPYMGRFPAAFRALVECMRAILTAYRDYNDELEIYLVEPSTAKAAVGVIKRGSNKDIVEKLLRERFKENCKPGEFHPSGYTFLMDEHSWDSLAINYYVLKLYDFFQGANNVR